MVHIVCFCLWWLDFKLDPIFDTPPAVSKNRARFKSGQNRLKSNHFTTLNKICEILCTLYLLGFISEKFALKVLSLEEFSGRPQQDGMLQLRQGVNFTNILCAAFSYKSFSIKLICTYII
jgi:hypothetical protein